MNEQETIEHRFQSDISRVAGLIALFRWHAANLHEDLSPDHKPDLLRAAVVLLHASLEDLFRSIAEWKLPTASPTSLDRIPLACTEKDKERFTLADLAEFCGQTVDWVIARSVESYLERSSYNNVGELTELLRKTGIEYAIPKEIRDKLAAMMSRRHRIAHRVDRDLSEEIDPGAPQRGLSILPEVVVEWKMAVIEVGEAVLKKL
jgi:RiboL-PSP-HEPN